MSSYLSVYTDSFRAHPLFPNRPYRPDEKCVELENGWFETGEKPTKVPRTEEETVEFYKKRSKDIWGTSTYREHYTDWSAKLIKDTVNRKQRNDKRNSKKNAVRINEEILKSSTKVMDENTLMMSMRETFEKDPERFFHQPLNSHKRILGYCRPRNYNCGLSVYQEDIGKPGYICMKDQLLKPIVKEDGRKPTYAVSPIFSLADGEKPLLWE